MQFFGKPKPQQLATTQTEILKEMAPTKIMGE
jgi:hypothetical protein